MKSLILPSLAATVAMNFAALGQGTTPRSENDLLKTIDSIGASPSRKPLSFEGTALDPKKAPKPEKKAQGQTEITALEATFDKKSGEAVFINKVLVKDPEFTVVCDRLIALLKKQNEKGTAAAPANANAQVAAKPSPVANPPPGAEATKPEKPKGGGLDKATAEANPGKMVEITQDKLEADGTISKNIGVSRKATYDANTGDIVLIGSPSVQQGINTCVATSDETIMILNRNGQMHVIGPHKTIIKDTNSSEGRN